MRKIITYFIILSFLQLFSRPMFNFKGLEKSIPDSIKNSKYFNENLIQNRTHRIGALKMNITNFGSMFSYKPILNGNWAPNNFFLDECTGEQAVTLEMPAGSGMEYLFLSSLWCGGYLESSVTNINSTQTIIFEGPLVSTSCEGYSSMLSYEFLPSSFDEDPTGKFLGSIKESSCIEGRMNCLFEDVYDPKATAYEQFASMYSDKPTNQITWDYYDNRGHIPLGIEVKQTTYAWPYDFAKKFIIVDYTIYNRNKDKKNIYDFFAGVYVDDDIKNKNLFNGAGYMDDICGFIEKWDSYIDPATGETKTVNMNLLWGADNDGREMINPDSMVWNPYEPDAGSPLNSATGIFTIRVLRNPNPNMRYSFNLYNPDTSDESLDWGPKWKTGFHTDWLFDLTPEQKGYDDSNYDSLYTLYGNIWLFGGRTEGNPIGDKGRYMIMSNDEFDYNQTSIREIYLGMDSQAD